MVLRIYVNMDVFVGSVLVCSTAITSVYKYATEILGNMGR